MPPGEVLDAGDLMARLGAGGADAPTLCALQHRLHEGWIEGFWSGATPADRATGAYRASPWPAGRQDRAPAQDEGAATAAAAGSAAGGMN